jgi:hypothetical protein
MASRIGNGTTKNSVSTEYGTGRYDATFRAAAIHRIMSVQTSMPLNAANALITTVAFESNESFEFQGCNW